MIILHFSYLQKIIKKFNILYRSAKDTPSQLKYSDKCRRCLIRLYVGKCIILHIGATKFKIYKKYC